MAACTRPDCSLLIRSVSWKCLFRMSIIPLQKPHSKKREVIRTKGTAKFLPSAVRNIPPCVLARPAGVVDGFVDVFIVLTFV